MIQNKKCEDKHSVDSCILQLSDHISFHIKNLGQIKEAVVNLKDLNIIMGHNSTSKTYLTHTIYGFYKFLLHTLHLLLSPKFADSYDNEMNTGGVVYASDYLASYGLKSPYFIDGLSINKWLLTKIDKIKHEPLSTLEFSIPLSELEEAISRDLNHLAEYYVKNCLSQDLAIDPALANTMLSGCSLQLLLNKNFLGVDLQLNQGQSLGDDLRFQRLTFLLNINNPWQTNDQFARMSFILKSCGLNITITNDVPFIEDKQPLDYGRVAKLLSGSVISHLWVVVSGLSFVNPFVISADRASIPLFYKELDANRSNLIRSMQNNPDFQRILGVEQLLQQQTGNYSQMVQDNINFVRSLSSYKKHYIRYTLDMNSNKDTKLDQSRIAINQFQNIADYLSQEINHGNYEIDEEFDQIYFVPLSQDRPVRIPIHNVSSSIKALLILDFYVKYVLPLPNSYKKFLIIDEPELSLHPDNQRKIARLLAMIVNTGVKVMCTTHSDFFIHEFNNLIGLSSLSEEDRQDIISIKFEGNKTIYASDMLLTQDQISCYEMSDKSSSNIVVEKCVVDKYGIEAKYIDDEGSKINNMMRNIQDKFW